MVRSFFRLLLQPEDRIKPVARRLDDAAAVLFDVAPEKRIESPKYMDDVKGQVPLNEWREVPDVQEEKHQLPLLPMVFSSRFNILADEYVYVGIIPDDAVQAHGSAGYIGLAGQPHIGRNWRQPAQRRLPGAERCQLFAALKDNDPAGRAFSLSPAGM